MPIFFALPGASAFERFNSKDKEAPNEPLEIHKLQALFSFPNFDIKIFSKNFS